MYTKIRWSRVIRWYVDYARLIFSSSSLTRQTAFRFVTNAKYQSCPRGVSIHFWNSVYRTSTYVWTGITMFPKKTFHNYCTAINANFPWMKLTTVWVTKFYFFSTVFSMVVVSMSLIREREREKRFIILFALLV